jgi:hypothetical protein
MACIDLLRTTGHSRNIQLQSVTPIPEPVAAQPHCAV